MSLLKKIWDLCSYFGTAPAEWKAFATGTGESEILKTAIIIRNYPFEPASVFPEKEIPAGEMDEIHPDQYPPTIRIKRELIFISRESVEMLREFAARNGIPVARRAANWSWITEPFLDTEFTREQQIRTLHLLAENDLPADEVTALRREVGGQLSKYNFDTMLWDWTDLGLFDVLAAMHLSLHREAFRQFYWRTMEIEQRKRKAS